MALTTVAPEPDTGSARFFRRHVVVFAGAVALLIGLGLLTGVDWVWWLVAALWFALLITHGAYIGLYEATPGGILSRLDGRLERRPPALDLPRPDYLKDTSRP